jgi:hypothetical protein
VRAIPAGLCVLVLSLAVGCSTSDHEAAGGDRTVGTTAAPTSAAEEQPAPGTYVGAVEGTDMYAAVVVGPDGAALAYLCDGTGNAVDWVAGGFGGGVAGLSNDGGTFVELRIQGDGISGTVARGDDAAVTFSAALAEAPAGLYRATASFADGDYVGGWIVLEDGTQRGTVRRYETPLPERPFAPVLDLDALVVEVPGGVLRAERQASDDTQLP